MQLKEEGGISLEFFYGVTKDTASTTAIYLWGASFHSVEVGQTYVVKSRGNSLGDVTNSRT